MAGGEVIRSQRHHLPVLTGLGFAAVGSLQSSSAAGGGLSMHKTAHRTQLRMLSKLLRRNIGPSPCLMAKVLFCPL